MAAKRDQPVQYTIRGVPPVVDRALRKKAREQKVSLNRLLVKELQTASGAPSPERNRSFDWLAGKWTHDPGFDRAIAEQHKVDWNLWK